MILTKQNFTNFLPPSHVAWPLFFSNCVPWLKEDTCSHVANIVNENVSKID